MAVRRLSVPAALALALLLCACAAGGTVEGAARRLPPDCRVVYRMESYEDGERTSHAVLTVAQNGSGVYYHAGGAEEFLFLEETPETYTMYIRSLTDGAFSVSEGEVVGREKVEQFAAGVLHIGLLAQDTEGMAETGESTAAGRPCRVYEGTRQAGEEYDLHSRLLIDEETGLTLGHWLRYTHRETGAETVYVMICELFETEEVALPAFFPAEPIEAESPARPGA